MASTTYAYNPSTKSYQAVATPSKAQQKSENAAIKAKIASKSSGGSSSSSSSKSSGVPSTTHVVQDTITSTGGYNNPNAQGSSSGNTYSALYAQQHIGGVTDADPSTIAMMEAKGELWGGEAQSQQQSFSNNQKDAYLAAQKREQYKTLKLAAEGKATQQRIDIYNAQKKAQAEKDYQANLLKIAEQMKERDKYNAEIAYNKLPVFGKENIQYDPTKRFWVYKKDGLKSDIQPEFSTKRTYLVPSDRTIPKANRNLFGQMKDKYQEYSGEASDWVKERVPETAGQAISGLKDQPGVPGGRFVSTIFDYGKSKWGDIEKSRDVVLSSAKALQKERDRIKPIPPLTLTATPSIFGRIKDYSSDKFEKILPFDKVLSTTEIISKKAPKLVVNYPEGFYQQTREYPLETAALAAASYGVGVVVSGLPTVLSGTATILGATPKIVSGINVATKGAMVVGGLGLTGAAVYQTGAAIKREPDWGKKGEILGRTTQQFTVAGLGFKGGAKTTSKAIGWYRTRGDKLIPLEKLTPPDVLSGETNFPAGGKTAKAELQLFQESPYRLPIEKMPTPNIYGKVSGKPSLVFAETYGKLPFKVPSAGYHATGYQWFKPGENLVSTVGSSELPGRYISHAVSPHFTRVTSVSGQNNWLTNIWKGLKTPSGKPVIISEQPEIFRISGFRTVKPYEVDGSIFTRMFKIKPKAGAADLPLMKLGGESEAIIRPGTGLYSVSKSGFYTKINGVRVPIMSSKYVPGTSTLNIKPIIAPEPTSAAIPSVSSVSSGYSLVLRPLPTPKVTSKISSVVSSPISLVGSSMVSSRVSSVVSSPVSSVVSSAVSSTRSSRVSSSKSSRVSSPRSSIVSSPMSSVVSSLRSSVVSSPRSSIVSSPKSSLVSSPIRPPTTTIVKRWHYGINKARPRRRITKSKPVRITRKYTPTYGGVVLGRRVSSKTKKKKKYTGLEIRPIRF